MGSYLSIENDTEDTYLVKVGADEEALRITFIVADVVGGIAAVAGGVGLVAKVAGSGAKTAVAVARAARTAEVAARTARAARAVKEVVGWSQTLSAAITTYLSDKKGFVEIRPGETHVFGKYSLSLWRQATCIRVRPNPNNADEVVMDTVYMRPIFSGPTDGSTQHHSIKYWVDRHGYQDHYVLNKSKSNDI